MHEKHGHVARQGALAIAWVYLWICLLSPASASAGLVFHLDEDIKVASVSAVLPEEDRLSFVIDGQHVVQDLPPGTRDLLIDWASRDPGGSIVISMDGALTPGGSNYTPPSMPEPLSSLLLSHDGYAHEVACGGVAWRAQDPHPLTRATGNDEQLPHRQDKKLLDPENRSPEALWYRRLAAHYSQPPGCVGELTLRARREDGTSLVRIEVDSWIHQRTRQWYRSADAPTEWDKWAARLPYRYLTRDLEENWNAYRDAFPPLDELTRIVETMATLRALRQQAPGVWNQLQQDVSEKPSSTELASEWEPRLSNPGFDDEAWRELSAAWIGAEVDTPAEANLALSLIRSGKDDLAAKIWRHGIEAVARQDARTQAKLDLHLLLSSSDVPGVDAVATLFASLQGIPQGFRLRAYAIKMLKNKRTTDPEVAAVLARETRRLLDDFVRRTRQHCESPSSDVNVWEDLSQDVYSTDLLTLVRGEGKGAPPKVLEAVACIHRHRGVALQVGRAFAYWHAHLRFLGYLGGLVTDSQTKMRIERYREEIARKTGVPTKEIER